MHAGCDPNQPALQWSGVTAQFQIDNGDIQLAFFRIEDLDIRDSTCAGECGDNADCVVYEETADGECAPHSTAAFNGTTSL